MRTVLSQTTRIRTLSIELKTVQGGPSKFAESVSSASHLLRELHEASEELTLTITLGFWKNATMDGLIADPDVKRSCRELEEALLGLPILRVTLKVPGSEPRSAFWLNAIDCLLPCLRKEKAISIIHGGE